MSAVETSPGPLDARGADKAIECAANTIDASAIGVTAQSGGHIKGPYIDVVGCGEVLHDLLGELAVFLLPVRVVPSRSRTVRVLALARRFLRPRHRCRRDVRGLGGLCGGNLRLRDDGLRNLGLLRGSRGTHQGLEGAESPSHRAEMRHNRSKFPFQRLLLDLQAGCARTEKPHCPQRWVCVLEGLSADGRVESLDHAMRLRSARGHSGCSGLSGRGAHRMAARVRSVPVRLPLMVCRAPCHIFRSPPVIGSTGQVDEGGGRSWTSMRRS